MRTTCIVIATLVLVLGAATTALAKGGPPAHAASAGPPDRSEDPGPPDHAASPHAGPGDETSTTSATAVEETEHETDDEGTSTPSDARETTTTIDETTAQPTTSADDGPTTNASTDDGSPSLASTQDAGLVRADDAPVRPLAGDAVEVGSPSSEANDAPTNQGAGATRATLAGLVPGALIGAVGVLALAVHHNGPCARPRPNLDPATGDEASSEQATEPEPAEAPAATGTEGGIVGVVTAGQQALDDGDVEAAVGWFETAVELAPDLQVARFCLGLCLDELGRLDEAEAELRTARELADDPMAAYAHASVLARLGQTREAVTILERLTGRVPDLRERLHDDEELANLRDHPRFLALLGDL